MGRPSTSFLSFNPTGLSDIKCDWINKLCEATCVDYVAVQEHFRKSKTIDKYFKEQFSEHNSYVIPGYREPGQDRGRPKAGLAQLSRKNLAIRKDRIITQSPRIQAQILNFEQSKMLWLNSYLPNDPLTHEFDETNLQAVLTEIEHILDSTEYDDVLWCGDLNWDMSRQSGFSVTMHRFLTRLGLSSLWESHSIDYTHVHTDGRSFTTLDHFICNERLIPLVTDCGPLHLGDNLSRHSPIMVRLDLGALPTRPKPSTFRPRRPAWYKATEAQVTRYKSELLARLEAIPVPVCLEGGECEDAKCQDATHSTERDSFVLDMLSSVIETSHATIPMVGGRKEAVRPDCGTMPGWQDIVAPAQKDTKFWHSVWQSAGRPTEGELFRIKQRTRARYHMAIKRVRRMADKIKSQKLFEAAMEGGADLLNEMRKSHGGKHAHDLPENIAGANGEDEICEKFKSVYSELYNSAETSAAMNVIKTEVEESITPESSHEVFKITGNVVKAAAAIMKSNKGDVSGSYGSDAIKNAPDLFFDHLACVYRSWLFHGTVTHSLLACAFMPLLKSSLKDPALTKNYRAIAGSSILLKLFDKVILILWGQQLASGSLQMGYKKKSSTAQCSYVMMETINHFLNHGSHPIMVALDMTMAFDMCRFDVLFAKIKLRLPSVITRALIFIYEKQFAWVRWGNTCKSSIFHIRNGTRQGSVLSPALFSIYVQDLLDDLQKLGVGCHVGETFVGAIAWADDFLLLAPNREAMQMMLNLATDFSVRHNLEFSCDPDPAKSKSKAIFMIGRNTKLQKPVNFMLAGKDLPWVSHATHLGHEFHEDGTICMDARMKRSSYIGWSLEVRESFSFAGPAQVLGVVELYASDLYGGMLWKLEDQLAQRVVNCWNTTINDVWGVTRATHTATARWLACGHSSFQKDLLAPWVKYFQSMLSMLTSASVELQQHQTTDSYQIWAWMLQQRLLSRERLGTGTGTSPGPSPGHFWSR